MQQNLFSVLYFIRLFSIARSALLKQHRLVMSSKAAAPQEENYQQVAMGMPNFEFAAPEANYTDQAVDFPRYDNQSQMEYDKNFYIEGFNVEYVKTQVDELINRLKEGDITRNNVYDYLSNVKQVMMGLKEVTKCDFVENKQQKQQQKMFGNHFANPSVSLQPAYE